MMFVNIVDSLTGEVLGLIVLAFIVIFALGFGQMSDHKQYDEIRETYEEYDANW